MGSRRPVKSAGDSRLKARPHHLDRFAAGEQPDRRVEERNRQFFEIDEQTVDHGTAPISIDHFQPGQSGGIDWCTHCHRGSIGCGPKHFGDLPADADDHIVGKTAPADRHCLASLLFEEAFAGAHSEHHRSQFCATISSREPTFKPCAEHATVERVDTAVDGDQEFAVQGQLALWRNPNQTAGVRQRTLDLRESPCVHPPQPDRAGRHLCFGIPQCIGVDRTAETELDRRSRACTRISVARQN